MSSVAATIPRVRVFQGVPEEVRHVRDFVRRLAGTCPAAEDVVLLASEMAANAVRHTASGAGGMFAVSVLAEDTWVRVEVHDLGSPTAPAVHQPGAPGESGAGLCLVDAIADRWGFHGSQRGRVVWFEIGGSRAGARGGNLAVSRYLCSCEFATGDGDEFGDHLRTEFAADDDTGTDGRQHYELADDAASPTGYRLPAFSCACGFVSNDVAALDDHLLGVFITPDRVGADGRAHVLAG